MKIVLTTMLVALLAIGLIGINYTSSNINTTGNAYAQMESEDSPMMQDDTEMMGMDMRMMEGMMMTTISNQSEEMKMEFE